MAIDAGPSDYELLDFGEGDLGEGARLERWGEVLLERPDARATGRRTRDRAAWGRADAVFSGRVGGGRWQARRDPPPDRWVVTHAGLRFAVGCAPSGHTGLFPEQAAHWAWIRATTPESIRTTPESFEVLNLFAYTGGASIALARAGARVTHVDASRPAIGRARENAALNAVDTIRWIQEDARRFVDRARRRGRRYAGLLLDPPAYGRGPAGDWRLERDLPDLLEAAVGLLQPQPAFVLVNVYTGDTSPGDLERLLAWALDRGDPGAAPLSIEAGTLSLAATDGRRLPTGIFVRAAPQGRADGPPGAAGG
jgi:23S rRNA (cytosine1962-C5)-methyltransferase